MKRRIGIALAILVAVLPIAGCGEKPCETEGALKVTNGHRFICADRKTGDGLRWYPN